jgi:hypothetical protein
MNKLFTVFFLALLYITFLRGQAAIDIPLTISDGIETKDWLAIGVDTSATNGIDAALGEADLPPFPPVGIFEVRFDLSPYAGEPLSSYKDFRNAPELPFVGVVQYNLIWQLSTGATTLDISYVLPGDVTINIKDMLGGILYDSGTLSDSGTYSIPQAFLSLKAALITMTATGPCPITQAANPNPVDMQTNLQLAGNSLNWTNGSGTVNVEVWFGPNGRALKLYDGPQINSWPLGDLNYGTQYSWFIVGKNEECYVSSPIWTFATVLDTNLVIDSILVYPQNLYNWTGSCNPSSKTEVSLVKGYNTEVGWMVFDLSAIPNNVTINSVEFNGYLYDNSWPYWAIAPMGNINPITDPASSVFNQISTHSNQGVAYSYNEESSTLNNDWLSRSLSSTVTLDVQNSLTKNWFAIGILDFDFSTSYYVKFQGWAEANRPYLKIIYSFHGETTFPFTYEMEDGWNLVSIPGLLPGNQNVNDWWPYRDMNTPVYSFTDIYQSQTMLTPAIGYWMKHLGVRTYNTGDEWPASGIRIVRHDPINTNSGWNIFGVYEEVVPASGLTTIPSGFQDGPIYGYSGGYFVTTQLVPGRGYWVKLSNDGQIIIPDASLKSRNEKINWIDENWCRIILNDSESKVCTLYAVQADVDLNHYEMPPVPPTGMFDIRFSSGRLAEDIDNSTQTIEMRGVVYPVTVSVEGMDIRLTDVTGIGMNTMLKSGESVTISDSRIDKLMVSGETIPTVYALEQNYPNPFNPSTVIEFSLPEDVSNVKLSVYNALGEKVAELVNSSLAAGRYSYQWNAKNVATGMYIYELRTDKFVSVKKMLFLK